MIEVQMNSDIKKYQPTIMLGLTTRRLITIAISVVPGTLAFLYANGLTLGNRLLFAFIFMTPVLAGGFLDISGMHLDEYAKNVFMGYVLQPKRRIYWTTRPLAYLGPRREETRKKKVKDVSPTWRPYISKPNKEKRKDKER